MNQLTDFALSCFGVANPNVDHCQKQTTAKISIQANDLLNAPLERLRLVLQTPIQLHKEFFKYHPGPYSYLAVNLDATAITSEDLADMYRMIMRPASNQMGIFYLDLSHWNVMSTRKAMTEFKLSLAWSLERTSSSGI